MTMLSYAAVAQANMWSNMINSDNGLIELDM